MKPGIDPAAATIADVLFGTGLGHMLDTLARAADVAAIARNSAKQQLDYLAGNFEERAPLHNPINDSDREHLLQHQRVVAAMQAIVDAADAIERAILAPVVPRPPALCVDCAGYHPGTVAYAESALNSALYGFRWTSCARCGKSATIAGTADDPNPATALPSQVDAMRADLERIRKRAEPMIPDRAPDMVIEFGTN